MKKLKNILLATSLIFTSGFFQLNANAFDQHITVKFKKPVSAKFLEKFNQMTDTTVVKVVPPATYKLQISGIANKDTLDRYSELFSIMLNVESVSPLSKEKISDKVQSYLYMNTQAEDDKQEKDKTPEENTQVTQVVPDELIIKFNKDVSPEDIETLNQSLGAEIIYQKETDSYKVKVPEHMGNEYVTNFYNGSGLINSIEQNKIVTTQKNAAPQVNKPAPKTKSGVITAIPLNTGKDIKVTFKIGQEKDLEWFNQIFGTQLVSTQGFSSYIIRFPGNINSQLLVRALKVCPSVSHVEISSD